MRAVNTMKLSMRNLIACLLLVASCTNPPQPTVEQLNACLDAIAVQSELRDCASIEVADASGIILLDDTDPYVGLRLYPFQPRINNGKRAEVVFDYPYHPGETVSYAWALMIPTVFPSDAPKNRWWIMAQWHDQPDRELGETWAGFPKHLPALLLEYGMDNNQDYLEFQYGAGNLQPVGRIPILRSQWLRLRLDIHWSQSADGSASLFVGDDASPTLVAQGPNMFNAFQHYFKLGQYRHPDINTENWVYIDEVSIVKQEGS